MGRGTRMSRADMARVVRNHPAFLYSYAPEPRDVRYVFCTTDATRTCVGLTEAYAYAKSLAAN